MKTNMNSLPPNLFDKQAIRVVQISTDDSGGAGMAANRLNSGLRKIGVDSSIVAKNKLSEDPAILQVNPTIASVDSGASAIARAIQTSCVDKYRTDVSNTYFNWPLLGYDLSTVPVVLRADVINLHWISFFQ